MSEAIAKTTKFLARMLTAFLRRQNPDSTSAKPAFIQNTRNAVIKTQIVSAMTLRSAFEGTPSAAAARLGSRSALDPRSTGKSLIARIFLILLISPNGDRLVVETD